MLCEWLQYESAIDLATVAEHRDLPFHVSGGVLQHALRTSTGERDEPGVISIKVRLHSLHRSNVFRTNQLSDGGPLGVTARNERSQRDRSSPASCLPGADLAHPNSESKTIRTTRGRKTDFMCSLETIYCSAKWHPDWEKSGAKCVPSSRSVRFLVASGGRGGGSIFYKLKVVLST